MVDADGPEHEHDGEEEDKSTPVDPAFQDDDEPQHHQKNLDNCKPLRAHVQHLQGGLHEQARHHPESPGGERQIQGERDQEVEQHRQQD